jgi:hypothetical protein
MAAPEQQRLMDDRVAELSRPTSPTPEPSQKSPPHPKKRAVPKATPIVQPAKQTAPAGPVKTPNMTPKPEPRNKLRHDALQDLENSTN